jgi:nucleoside 2-deoxyribosyltransferase
LRRQTFSRKTADPSRLKIYFAAPLFTTAEREWNARVAKHLRLASLDVWLPQELEPRASTAESIFMADVKGIEQADIVVAVMDGPDPDSGTCWECGYAYAKGKPIITVRTDLRKTGDADGTPFNLMLSVSANVNIADRLAATPKIAGQIVTAVRKHWKQTFPQHYRK